MNEAEATVALDGETQDVSITPLGGQPEPEQPELSEVQQQNLQSLTRLSGQGFDVEAFVGRLRFEVLCAFLMPDGPMRGTFEALFQENLRIHLAEQEAAATRAALTAGVATNIPKDALPPGMGLAQ